MIKMTVFAGNPGIEYKNTRHNIGWMILDTINYSNTFNWKKKFNALWSYYYVEHNKIIFLQPEIFMNKTGKSVQAATQFFKIKPDEIIIIHDDLELPFGKIVLKKGGGTGGHNALRSMDKHLNSSEYYRLRLGIGRPVHGSISSYVLGSFSADEKIQLETVVNNGAYTLKNILSLPIETAFTKYCSNSIDNISYQNRKK